MDIDEGLFATKLDAIEARLRAMEAQRHDIHITATLSQADLTKARTALGRFDNLLSQDAIARQRSGRGILAGLLGRVSPGGGAGASLFGGLIGGGAVSAAQNTVRQQMAALDAAMSRDAARRAGMLAGMAGGGGGGGNISPGWLGRGAVSGAGPGIWGLGAKYASIGGLGAAGLGALPGILGPAAGLLGGGLGLGALGFAVKGITSNLQPYTSAFQQLQVARSMAVTPLQKQQVATQQAGLNQAVSQLSPALQSIYGTITKISDQWQKFTYSLAPSLSKGFAQIPRLLSSFFPLFRIATQLMGPLIGGLTVIARDIIPGLGQTFRAAVPLLLPLLSGLGLLIKGILPGLVTIMRAALPSVKIFAQILGTLGKDIGGLFKAATPAINQGAIIFQEIMKVVGELLPIIGQLATIMARTLAPIFKVFAGVVRGLLPVLVFIGKIIGSLALAILGALVGALKAIAILIKDLAPSFTILAKAMAAVFKILENSGIFGTLGTALERLAPAIAQMINSLVKGLAPILPVIFKFISDLSTVIVVQLVRAIVALLPPLTKLVTDVLASLATILPVLLPLLVQLTAIFTASVVDAISAIATALAAIINAVPPQVLGGIITGFLAIAGAVKLWAIAQGILDGLLAGNPIGLLAIAIGGVTVGIIALVKHWGAVSGFIRKWGLDLAAAATAMALLSRLGIVKTGIKIVGTAAGWLARLFSGGAADLGAAGMQTAADTMAAAAAAMQRAADTMAGAAGASVAGAGSGAGAAGAAGAAAGGGRIAGLASGLSAVALPVLAALIVGKLIAHFSPAPTAQQTASYQKQTPGPVQAVEGFIFGSKAPTTQWAQGLIGSFLLVRHNIANIFNGIRHDVSSIWDTTWNNTIGRLRRGWADEQAILSNFQHTISSEFDRIRHDVSSIWDTVWSNTIGRLIRGVRDTGRWLSNMRHDIAGQFDSIRHQVAAAWDNIWSTTIAKVQNGISAVVGWFRGLPGRLIGALAGVGTMMYNAGHFALTELWNGVKSVVPSITSFLSGFAHGIVGVFKKIWGWFSPSSVMYQGGKSLMEGLAMGIRDHAHKAVTAAARAAAAASGGAIYKGHGQVPGVPPGSGVQRFAGIVLQILKMLGQPASALGTVLSQMTTESGGNATAVNRTDSNWIAGHPSVGLLQVIAGTFASYAGRYRNVGPFEYGVSINPFANIYAGLNYAIHRYGAGWQSVLGHGHGYDTGGWLPPGATLAFNQTGRREAILTPAQSKAFVALGEQARLFARGQGAAGTGSMMRDVYITLPEGGTVAQALNEIAFHLKAAEMGGFAGVIP
jgi:hypothetical protein